MEELRDLKLKQISEAVKEGRLMSVEDIGHRIRDIREALGISQVQLSKRLKISQSSLSKIEEDAGSTTIKTLVKIVAGLQCEFKGVVVSSEGLENIIKTRAKIKAKEMLNRTFASMAMEQQSPTDNAYNYQLNKLHEELINNPGTNLWEEKLLLIEDITGATPIDDISDLIPSHISTHSELNEWEAANILKAVKKYLTEKRNIEINLSWLKNVHKEMFGETWTWAGEFRQKNLNLGVDWHNIN